MAKWSAKRWGTRAEDVTELRVVRWRRPKGRAQHKRPGKQAKLDRRIRALQRLEASWTRIQEYAKTAPLTYMNARVKEINGLRRNLGMEPLTNLRTSPPVWGSHNPTG